MADLKTIEPVVAAAVDGAEGTAIPVTANGNVLDDGLQRGLKRRHLQMIALGGVIGPSIWYGTGYALSYSGPVGALICFLIVGLDVFFVMQSLGEICTMYPTPGAFTEMAGRFLDPAVAFALGWNYWYLWISNLSNEYNGLSIVLGLWTDKVPSWGWILLSCAFFQCTALLPITAYGEMEFWFASWKVLCVLGGFLVAILLNTGAIGGSYIGFRYWSDPGPFVNGISGFAQTLVLAAVYYCGTEMVAVTAGESKNPKRDLPAAIKQSFFRIFVVFIGMVFFASLICPSNSPFFLTASSKSGLSPWTIALVSAGWRSAGHLVNVVIVTANLSAINSSIYIASRTLLSLARQRRAPAFFARTTAAGVPLRAVVFSNLLGLISLMNVGTKAGKVFSYLVTISGAATFIAWAAIGVMHLRFRRAWVRQGRSVDDLPFRALWYPGGAVFVAAINVFFVLIQGYQTLSPFAAADFVVAYIVIVLFVVLAVFWKFWKGTKWVRLEEMDLVSGTREDLPELKNMEEKKASFLLQMRRLFFA
ncbi:putative amino acid permease protein [Neofusicoccum parvum UCRNP2]|uniref:Putative amino acid permease protein n=1 Tax=Botryosphaeria parva (strain UCR-NP2) TaxID=1287680 RepID=R1G1P6_BOTPV|nr:putative amino acid permease protein [Neofusicoccum parvum UCRNP2]